MATFRKINCNEVKLGMRFSAPVFFDDGKNMFISEGKAIKQWHLDSLKKWPIPFLLTYGRQLSESEYHEYLEGIGASDLEELSDE
ncbi:MAG: phosphohydrolase [Treponema sp.]|nr:phosphohydrolase [Treponema sp.]